MFLKPYFWLFTWSPTGVSSGNLGITWKLWVNETFVLAVNCHEWSGIVFMHSYTHRHSRWRRGGQFHQSLSPAHGGGLKIAVLFVSHSQSFTFSYPLVYLSTQSIHLSFSLSLPTSWSLSLCLSLCFPTGLSFCPSGHFWCLTFLGQSSWPAGMRGSYQTSQMVEVFLVMKSWTWNNTLANCSSRYELSREKKSTPVTIHPCIQRFLIIVNFGGDIQERIYLFSDWAVSNILKTSEIIPWARLRCDSKCPKFRNAIETQNHSSSLCKFNRRENEKFKIKLIVTSYISFR